MTALRSSPQWPKLLTTLEENGIRNLTMYRRPLSSDDQKVMFTRMEYTGEDLQGALKEIASTEEGKQWLEINGWEQDDNGDYDVDVNQEEVFFDEHAPCDFQRLKNKPKFQ